MSAAFAGQFQDPCWVLRLILQRIGKLRTGPYNSAHNPDQKRLSQQITSSLSRHARAARVESLSCRSRRHFPKMHAVD